MGSPDRPGSELSGTATALRFSRLDTPAALLLGTAVAYGALDQGGFYPEQFLNVLLLVVLALLAAALPRPVRPAAYVVGCALAWLGFAGWVLLLGSGQGDVAAALPVAAVATGLAAAVWAAGSLGGPARRLLAVVLVAVGIVVAATSWLGVALHLAPLALPSGGLWRAASTLTYANAAAALLVTAILVAVAVLPGSRPRSSSAVLTALVIGLAATMSRAGLLALGIGLLVAATAPDLRRRLAAAWPALPAAACGWAGLMPSLLEGSDARPLLALAGLGGAAAVLLMAPSWPRTTSVTALATAAGAALLLPSVLAGIVDTRLTTASAERADLIRVTWAQLWSAPLSGVGPGRLDLAYVDHSGVPVLAQFTHQEYLQLAAETGLVGLVLVLAGAAALALGAVRAWFRVREPGPVAALAVVTAFAVHSAFDFLWHVPALPLLTVLGAVALVPAHPSPSPERNP